MVSDGYEIDEFQSKILESWDTIRPLFEQVHAYVPQRLRKEDKKDIQKKGPIPDHVLGSMWIVLEVTQKTIRPFPNELSLDVTQSMKNSR